MQVQWAQAFLIVSGCAEIIEQGVDGRILHYGKYCKRAADQGGEQDAFALADMTNPDQVKADCGWNENKIPDQVEY